MIESLEARRLLSTVATTPAKASSTTDKLDLTNNKLIVANSQTGTWVGTTYTGSTGLDQTNVGDLPSHTTAISAGELFGITGSQTALFGGQTVTAADTLLISSYGTDPAQSEFSGTAKNDHITVTTFASDLMVAIGGLKMITTARSLRINANSGDDNVLIDLADSDAHITIYGAAGDDTIVGGAEPDRIFAGDGNDLVNGGGGKDSIYGDAGDDSVRGGGSSDLIDGGDGADTLRGDAGNDHIIGGADSDRLRGSAGNDTLDGGGGRDLLAGEDGDDSLLGGRGDDFCDGGAGNDTLRGNADNDVVTGDAGDDDLLGDAGVDSVTGGSGIDTFHTSNYSNYGSNEPFAVDSPSEISDQPMVPGNVSTEYDGESAVTVRWQYPSDEEVIAFNVQQSFDQGKTWQTDVAYATGATREFYVDGLGDGASWQFRMFTESYGGASAMSAATSPIKIAPAKPQYLSGEQEYDAIKFDWFDRSVAESYTQLFVQKEGGGYAKVATVPATADVSEITHTVRHLNMVADTKYNIFVRVFYKDGSHADSEVYSFTSDPPRVDIGASEVTIPPDSTFKLTIDAIGVNPSDYGWTIDWGDYSAVETVAAGTSPDQLVRSHFYGGADYERAFTIEVTPLEGTNWLNEGWKTVLVAPRGA